MSVCARCSSEAVTIDPRYPRSDIAALCVDCAAVIYDELIEAADEKTVGLRERKEELLKSELKPDSRLCPVCGNGNTMSKPVTFGELEVGDHFICFPRDGDDSGHGGFRGGDHLFQKRSGRVIRGRVDGVVYDPSLHPAQRKFDGARSDFPTSMLVIKVIP